MKIVLIREGNTLRPESGKLPQDLPDRWIVDIGERETQKELFHAVGVWSPIFPPGIGAEIEKELSRKTTHAGKRSKS